MQSENDTNVVSMAGTPLQATIDTDVDDLANIPIDYSLEDIFGNDKMLSQMNEKHAIIIDYGGKPKISTYTYSNVYDKKMLTFIPVESFKLQYCNQTVTLGDKVMPLGIWWINHPKRKEYKTIVFDPSKPKEFDGCLNLWDGFNVSPIKGNWKKTLKHIYVVISNRDKVKFKYFIRWLAFSVQCPHKPAEVAVVLKGLKGAGKGIIFTQMVRIFGSHGTTIADRNRFTGQFNDIFDKLAFLFADEAYYPGDKEVEGKLKSYITEPIISVEGKGLRPIDIKNCLHIAMATNNEWVIPATKDERRFYINEVDNRYAKGQCSDKVRIAYFKSIHREMDSGGREAMLYDLLNMNIDKWHPRDYIPDTSELRNQMSYSLSIEEKAFGQLLDEAIFPGKLAKSGYKISSEVLYEYMGKLDTNTLKISSVRKSKVMKKLGCEKVRHGDGVYWAFPSLREMRITYLREIGPYAFTEYEEWMCQNETTKPSF